MLPTDKAVQLPQNSAERSTTSYVITTYVLCIQVLRTEGAILPLWPYSEEPWGAPLLRFRRRVRVAYLTHGP
jgi:hypothetical protein